MSQLIRSPRWLALSMTVLLVLVSVATLAPAALGQVVPAARDDNAAVRACRDGDPFFRTELFFGSNKPDGTVVSEADFQKFLNDEITPRFPDGLTLLTGLGQFKNSSGLIERERSMLLILLYPRDSARDASRKIDQIRAIYERRFDQESVLRADDPLPQCVSF